MFPLKVTVLMPVYNGEAYLAAAINSILNQTFRNFELLIINDGSTDNSRVIADSFNDSRIRIIENEKNLGLVKTRNRGLKEAQGEYIAMLDSDDIALPTRLALQVNFLDKNPDYGLVASQIVVIDNEGRKKEIVKYNDESEDIPAILLFHNYLAQSTVMVRSDLIKSFKYRPEYPMSEDYDLWVRISRKTKIKILQEPLVNYRLHTNNITILKAQEEAKAIKQIVLNQLTLLNINPSPDELNLHFRSVKYGFKRNKAYINNSAAWLVKLYEANLVAKVYDVEAFQRVLVHRFILICGNSGLGLEALKLFFKFPLINFNNFNLTQIIKLLIKSIIRG